MMRNINWLLLLISLAIHLAVLACLHINATVNTLPRNNIYLTLVDKPKAQVIVQPAIATTAPAKPVARKQTQQQKRGLDVAKSTPIISQRPIEHASDARIVLSNPAAEESNNELKQVDRAGTPALEENPVPRNPAQKQAKPLSMPVPPPEPTPKPAVDVAAVLRDYAGTIKRAVLLRQYYPGSAERLGHAGVAQVGFKIQADGSLDGLRIKSTSGYKSLDQAALDAVRNAAPFKPIPSSSLRESLSLSISLKFAVE